MRQYLLNLPFVSQERPQKQFWKKKFELIIHTEVSYTAKQFCTDILKQRHPTVDPELHFPWIVPIIIGIISYCNGVQKTTHAKLFYIIIRTHIISSLYWCNGFHVARMQFKFCQSFAHHTKGWEGLLSSANDPCNSSLCVSGKLSSLRDLTYNVCNLQRRYGCAEWLDDSKQLHWNTRKETLVT